MKNYLLGRVKYLLHPLMQMIDRNTAKTAHSCIQIYHDEFYNKFISSLVAADLNQKTDCIAPVFVDPVIGSRPGMREADRNFSERYPPYLLGVVEQRLTVSDLGIRWAAEVPHGTLADLVKDKNYLVIVANEADEALARDLGLAFAPIEDYLKPAFTARDLRRNLALFNADAAAKLLLRPDLMQALVDHTDSSLLLPVVTPLADYTALWDANWSGRRTGLFEHRRLIDISRPGYMTLLCNEPDWCERLLSFKVAVRQPLNSVLRLESPQGRQEWHLCDNISELKAPIWIRQGRNPLRFSLLTRKSGAGLFCDIGDLRVECVNGEKPISKLRTDCDDDGELLMASLFSALQRLHCFGFMSSIFDVYSRGSRIDTLSGAATTRMSDLSPIINSDLNFAAQEPGAPQRATVLIQLHRSEPI